MRVETAVKTRRCCCGAKIAPGEDHFARYIIAGGYQKRINYCVPCACGRDHYTVKEAIKEYIAKYPDKENYIKLKCIQGGIRL